MLFYIYRYSLTVAMCAVLCVSIIHVLVERKIFAYALKTLGGWGVGGGLLHFWLNVKMNSRRLMYSKCLGAERQTDGERRGERQKKPNKRNARMCAVHVKPEPTP